MASAAGKTSVYSSMTERAGSSRGFYEKHPSFGYIGFEVRDFNDDGAPDILTLNGDNGDSDPYNTLKRDHGIYVNRGELNFEEAYFIHVWGLWSEVKISIRWGSGYRGYRLHRISMRRSRRTRISRADVGPGV